VSIVGEHSTQHLRYDAPLTADIEAFARPVSGWVRTLESASRMGEAAAECVRAAYGPPGQVATLIIPADYSWSEAGVPGAALPVPERACVDAEAVRYAARLLRRGPEAGILLGGSALDERSLALACGIAAATGLACSPVRISLACSAADRGLGRSGWPTSRSRPRRCSRVCAIWCWWKASRRSRSSGIRRGGVIWRLRIARCTCSQGSNRRACGGRDAGEGAWGGVEGKWMAGATACGVAGRGSADATKHRAGVGGAASGRRDCLR
jgi:hypothetical protein